MCFSSFPVGRRLLAPRNVPRGRVSWPLILGSSLYRQPMLWLPCFHRDPAVFRLQVVWSLPLDPLSSSFFFLSTEASSDYCFLLLFIALQHGLSVSPSLSLSLSLLIPHSWILTPSSVQFSLLSACLLLCSSPLSVLPSCSVLFPCFLSLREQEAGENEGGIIWEACDSPILAWGLVSPGWKFYHSFFVTDQGRRNENYKERKRRNWFASPELT